MAGRERKTTLLTNLELEVMQVVWNAAGPVSVREVVDGLNEDRKKPLAYNTVQTMLTILREKGVVSARQGAGRAHTFQARRSREEMTTNMVGDLVERLFEGQAQPLLLHLVEHEALSPDQLRELRRVVERHLDDPDEGSADAGQANGRKDAP